MNRNLDGTKLTLHQLLHLAGPDAPGKISGYGPNMARSTLEDLTRQLRYEMFLRGELQLDTRPEQKVHNRT